mgnify:CR=1 FL=1
MTERPCIRDGPLQGDDASDERLAILALVDALAVLAADLWFDGKLMGIAVREDASDE